MISKFKILLIGREQKKKKSKSPKANKAKGKKNATTGKQADAAQVQPKEHETAAGAAAQTKGKKANLKPWIDAVMTYWRELLALVGHILTAPTLDILRLEVWVGGKDAEACAMTYGRICAMIGSVLPVVENTFGIRKRKIDVWCCFDRDDMEISAEATVTVRIYEIFALVFALLGLGIKLLLEARNNTKAVQ